MQDHEPRPPRAILFDLFHTLVLVRAGADLGPHTWTDLGVSRDDWNREWFVDGDGRATGEVRCPIEMIRLVAHRIDPTIPHDRIERAASRRRRRFQVALREIEPGVLAGLTRLRAAGVRLGLVSNATWDEIEPWGDSPLAPLFDTAVFSCAAGVAKPDPGIYHVALDALGVAANDAWFVGDGGSDELRGAAAVGLHPVLLLHMLRPTWPEKVAERRPHARAALEDVHAVADAALRGALPEGGAPA